MTSLTALFNGNLYIEPNYGFSLLPSIYSEFKNPVNLQATDEQELVKAVVKTQEVTTVNNTKTQVAVINFNQPVVKYSSWSYLGTQTLIKHISQIVNDPDVSGLVLNIDSGGGQVYGTAEFYDFIKTIKKPVVTYTGGYLCSAAYYMAAASNAIIANPRADAIGSIGAYATFIDSAGILKHFGAEIHTIYASKSSEKNSEYREIMENGNVEPYAKNVLDPIVETFISDMKAARPGLDDQVFKGGTWNGLEALELGLIDQNGTITDAINTVIELSQNNLNPIYNMKTRTRLQAALSLDDPLASTEEQGSYLNEEQLDALETSLEASETVNTDLQTQLDAALANTELNDQVTAANDSLNAAEATVNTMLEEAGLETAGTLTEKLTALNGKVTEMAKKDGANPTKTKIDVEEPTKGSIKLDPNASHNQLADQILN